MKLHSGMQEVEFIKEIDESFYFDSDAEYEEAARVGCAISDNAALAVGYELAMGSSYASDEGNLRMLEILEKERPTPVVLAAVPVIRSLLQLEPVARGDVLGLLSACRRHDNAWSGLGIVMRADASLEKECEEIMRDWRKARNLPEEH